MRRRLLAALVLALAAPAAAQEVSPPPGERPVRVQAGAFLLNLSEIGERSTTFDANLYLSFRWRDTRLAFKGTEPQRFLEDAAMARLDQIWWPQLKAVNADQPRITSRVMEIAPDGTVHIRFGMASRFRTHIDLRRFPFDRQTLIVRIQSFLWTADQMVFVPDAGRVGFNPDSTLDALRVTDLETTAGLNALANWEQDFSDFIVRIKVKREFTFYIWTVFVPVTLIFIVSCAAFAISPANFHDRLVIALTALLTCVGTQFSVSVHLPRVSYLTVIDRVFVVAYVSVAVCVAVSTLEATILSRDSARLARIDRWAGVGLPMLFLGLILWCIFG